MAMSKADRDKILLAADKAYNLVVGTREKKDYPVQIRVTQPSHEVGAILINIVDTNTGE